LGKKEGWKEPCCHVEKDGGSIILIQSVVAKEYLPVKPTKLLEIDSDDPFEQNLRHPKSEITIINYNY